MQNLKAFQRDEDALHDKREFFDGWQSGPCLCELMVLSDGTEPFRNHYKWQQKTELRNKKQTHCQFVRWALMIPCGVLCIWDGENACDSGLRPYHLASQGPGPAPLALLPASIRARPCKAMTNSWPKLRLFDQLLINGLVVSINWCLFKKMVSSLLLYTHTS